MTKHEVRILKSSTIFLDERNPRFPPVKNQREAIKIMVDDLGIKITNLAQHIYQYGLNPSQRLIVFAENGRLVDGDGNRRLAAIKILETPQLLDFNPSLRRRIEKTLKQEGRVPDEVECVVFNDRESARIWIQINHSGLQDGLGQHPWISEQKDRFDGKKSIGTQAMDFLQQNNLMSVEDKAQLQKTTVDRFLSFRKIKNLLGILGTKGDFEFRQPDLLKKMILGLRGVKVNVVYNSALAVEFADSLLRDNDSKPETESATDIVEGLRSGTGPKPTEPPNERQLPPQGGQSDAPHQQESKPTRTRRTKQVRVQVFGRVLSLKPGAANDLYREIEALYRIYQEGKSELTENFIPIFRASLRLLVETAAADYDKPTIDKYIKSNFQEGKRFLCQDQKTTLSSQKVTKKSLVQLFHTGAHRYSASKNEEQAIAISLILGGMLQHSHGKDE